MTREWMENTFLEEYREEAAKTGYVCGNPFTEYAEFDLDLAYLDEVWRYGWDEELGLLPPRPVTDRAISHWRQGDSERMLVHYMQPHTPFIDLENRSKAQPHNIFVSGDEWQRVEAGELEFERAWDAYEENLRIVLDDVELLLRSIDAERVVVTSDHGHCVGELGLWKHPEKLPIDALRKVPWIETSATDENDYEPEAYDTTPDYDPNEQLERLGYI